MSADKYLGIFSHQMATFVYIFQSANLTTIVPSIKCRQKLSIFDKNYDDDDSNINDNDGDDNDKHNDDDDDDDDDNVKNYFTL